MTASEAPGRRSAGSRSGSIWTSTAAPAIPTASPATDPAAPVSTPRASMTARRVGADAPLTASRASERVSRRAPTPNAGPMSQTASRSPTTTSAAITATESQLMWPNQDRAADVWGAGGSRSTSRLVTNAPAALMRWTSDHVTGSSPATYQSGRSRPTEVTSSGGAIRPGSGRRTGEIPSMYRAATPLIVAVAVVSSSNVSSTVSPRSNPRSRCRSVTAISPAWGRRPSSSGNRDATSGSARSVWTATDMAAPSPSSRRTWPFSAGTSRSPSGTRRSRSRSRSAYGVETRSSA